MKQPPKNQSYHNAQHGSCKDVARIMHTYIYTAVT